MTENRDLVKTKRELRKLAKEKFENKYSAKQLQVMYMLANPALGLKKKEICEQAGISVVTLWRWEARPGFLDDVYQLAHHYCKEGLPDALRALNKQAAKGDIRAIELLLKVSGKFTDKQELDIRAGRLEKVSDQELDQIIANYKEEQKPKEIEVIEQEKTDEEEQG